MSNQKSALYKSSAWSTTLSICIHTVYRSAHTGGTCTCTGGSNSSLLDTTNMTQTHQRSSPTSRHTSVKMTDWINTLFSLRSSCWRGTEITRARFQRPRQQLHRDARCWGGDLSWADASCGEKAPICSPKVLDRSSASDQFLKSCPGARDLSVRGSATDHLGVLKLSGRVVVLVICE